MWRLKALSFICFLALFLAGCSSAGAGGTGGESLPPDSAPVSETAGTAEEQKKVSPPASPAKEEVFAAREAALEGMSQEQIDRLREVVIAANLALEQGYLNDNLFGKLEDPDSLTWNYFDRTGEIQVGWAYDGDLDIEDVCTREGLTEEEFYSKYGTPVSDTNRHTADGFIALMGELEASAQNQNLKAELRDLAEEMELAKGHVMERVNNVYKKLHDLDYFLLRYGPEVFDSYQSDYDKSTVSKYYGTLSFYA